MGIEKDDYLLVNHAAGGEPVAFPCIVPKGDDYGAIIPTADAKGCMCKGVPPEEDDPAFTTQSADNKTVAMKADVEVVTCEDVNSESDIESVVLGLSIIKTARKKHFVTSGGCVTLDTDVSAVFNLAVSGVMSRTSPTNVAPAFSGSTLDDLTATGTSSMYDNIGDDFECQKSFALNPGEGGFSTSLSCGFSSALGVDAWGFGYSELASLNWRCSFIPEVNSHAYIVPTQGEFGANTIPTWFACSDPLPDISYCNNVINDYACDSALLYFNERPPFGSTWNASFWSELSAKFPRAASIAFSIDRKYSDCAGSCIKTEYTSEIDVVITVTPV